MKGNKVSVGKSVVNVTEQSTERKEIDAFRDNQWRTERRHMKEVEENGKLPFPDRLPNA